MPRHPVAGVEEPAARGQFSSRPGGPAATYPGMGITRCRRIVLAVLTVAELLTGSAPAALAAPPGDGPAPLEFVPCEGLDCATLVVLVNHTDPEGATTELPVLRHRATDPARRLGVLLVNPGGPGAPAGDQVRRRGSDRSRAGDPAGLADPLPVGSRHDRQPPRCGVAHRRRHWPRRPRKQRRVRGRCGGHLLVHRPHPPAGTTCVQQPPASAALPPPPPS